MTKKEKILNVALRLFSEEGFDAVSTKRIAGQAKVSEALIFRHFGSKAALLQRILELGAERIQYLFHAFYEEDDPREALRMAISIVFEVDEKEYGFWRLQYQLKWKENINKVDKVSPIVNKLTWAFTALNYQQPDLEADFLMKTIDIMAISILQEGLESQLKMQDFLIKKYEL